jgi:hypothetical protein
VARGCGKVAERLQRGGRPVAKGLQKGGIARQKVCEKYGGGRSIQNWIQAAGKVNQAAKHEGLYHRFYVQPQLFLVAGHIVQ